MLARRLLVMLAILMLLTAIAAGVAPRRSALDQNDATAPSATPTEQTSATIERTLDAAESGQRVTARVGQTVVLEIRSQELDTVTLAEYGSEPVEADSPARFELLADVPGRYTIELMEAEREIGALEILDPQP